jgi:O-acetyl-ADP-ribose deacetylase (regulator of RNase III)
MGAMAEDNISTGIYGFPKERAAKIALAEARAHHETEHSVDKIIFSIFDPDNFEIYNREIG